MLTPDAVVNGPSDYRYVFYTPFKSSYFYVSYDNWFPIIIAMLSIVTLVLLVVKAVAQAKRKATGNSILVCTLLLICIVASPPSWLIYGGTVTFIGIIVFLLHIITFILQIKSKNRIGVV
jgi:O-antigen ligase